MTDKVLFSSQTWLGEFHIPGKSGCRFFGEISFSPENGPTFSYTIRGSDDPPECSELHGTLNDGRLCTIIGNFGGRGLGCTTYRGYTTRQGKTGAPFFIIGDHVTKETLFDRASFSFTGLQEFFFHTGFKSQEKFDDKPIFNLKVDFGEIELFKTASFRDFYISEIDLLLYSHNSSDLTALKIEMEKFHKNHPDSYFLIKDDIAYRFLLKFKEGITIDSVSKHVMRIAELFALLRCKPTYPESFDAIRTGEHHNMQIFPWLGLNKATVELAKKDEFHFHLPITNKDIDLPSVLERWILSSARFETLILAIQHEIGFRTLHSAHGDIVLLATQLEDISYQAGQKMNKYAFPIQTYGSAQLQDKLEEVFLLAGIGNLGRGVDMLRNEVAHVGRPRNILNKITLGHLIKIIRCLQLVVLGFVLESVGIDKMVREKYQAQLLPS